MPWRTEEQRRLPERLTRDALVGVGELQLIPAWGREGARHCDARREEAHHLPGPGPSGVPLAKGRARDGRHPRARGGARAAERHEPRDVLVVRRRVVVVVEAVGLQRCQRKAERVREEVGVRSPCVWRVCGGVSSPADDSEVRRHAHLIQGGADAAKGRAGGGRSTCRSSACSRSARSRAKSGSGPSRALPPSSSACSQGGGGTPL